MKLSTMVSIVKAGIELGAVEVSTVELGTHNIAYETMIFGRSIDLNYISSWRYKTEEAARIGHTKIVEALKNRKYLITPATYNLALTVEVPE